MNRILVSGLAIVLTLAIVPGCATKEQTGAVVGGVAGGLLGSQIGGGKGNTAAIILGTLGGAAIGSMVGRRMDDKDRARMAQALETSRSNQTTSWRNPDTANAYAVTPVKTTFPSSADGQPCRQFKMNAVIDGKTQETYGTACRQLDGSWKIVQ